MCVCVRWGAFACVRVRTRRLQLSGMRKTKPTPSPNLPAAPAREAVRTPLFWLLYDSHARLSENWDGNRIRWAAVCAWAAAHGVPDQLPNAVRMTWARVCAAKAHEKAKREAKQRPAYARSPPTSQPPPVAASSPNRSHPPPAQGAASAEDVVDELNAFIRRRSGRS